MEKKIDFTSREQARMLILDLVSLNKMLKIAADRGDSDPELEVRCKSHIEQGSRVSYDKIGKCLEVKCIVCDRINAMIAIAEESESRKAGA